MIEEFVRQGQETQSESIAELAKALSKVQGELKGAVKDSKNPFFNSQYADLASVWEACRKQLAEAELAVIQTNGGTGECPSIITTLVHSSGEWIRGELPMTTDRKGPQAIGSAITYARRYALAGMVGICPADDDGEGATSRNGSGEKKGSGRNGKVTSEDVVVSEEQVTYAIENCDMNEKEVIESLAKNFGKESLDQLTVKELQDWWKIIGKDKKEAGKK